MVRVTVHRLLPSSGALLDLMELSYCPHTLLIKILHRHLYWKVLNTFQKGRGVGVGTAFTRTQLVYKDLKLIITTEGRRGL